MQLERLVTSTCHVVRGVKPDRMSAPTPCADWDVRALANHLLQVITALRLAGQGSPVPDELWARDMMSDGWVERFESESREAVEAWAEPGAMERSVSMGGGEMPAGMALSMFASDLVIHGWDLARATGQDYECDESAAEVALRFITETGEQGRGMGIYGTPVDVDGGAPALDRALGLSGRDPRWVREAVWSGASRVPDENEDHVETA